MTSLLNWIPLAALLGTACIASASDPAALAKRLHNAAELSSLDDPILKPWHLRLDVQLYDDKGQPSEKGTIEEWWTPDKDKRVYTTPSYTATEIRDGKTIYRTKGAENVPYLLDAMRRNVVHPVISGQAINESELEQKVVSFGKTKLDCIILKKRGTPYEATVGVAQTYCFDEGKDQLRASWLDPEIDSISGIGAFQGKVIGSSSSVAVFGVRASNLQVETLAAFTPDDKLFVHDIEFEDRTAGPVWLNPGELRNTSVKQDPPKYPEQAKLNHISGTVLLEATLEKDGRIGMLKVIGHPDARLAEASLDAVRNWVYKPYVVNGAPVEVQTRIKIAFHFGGR